MAEGNEAGERSVPTYIEISGGREVWIDLANAASGRFYSFEYR